MGVVLWVIAIWAGVDVALMALWFGLTRGRHRKRVDGMIRDAEHYANRERPRVLSRTR